MTIRGIVFDKDGTLFNFVATWESWARAFLLRIAGGKVETAARLGAAIGFDFAAGHFHPGSVVIAGTPGDIAAALAPVLPDMAQDELIAVMNAEAARAPQVEAVPLAPFLAGLRDRGLRLGLATNDAQVPARAHLVAAGVLDAFDFVAGCDSGFGAKPGPGQILGCEPVFFDHSVEFYIFEVL